MDDIELTNDQILAIMSLEPWWHKADSKQVFSISGAAGTGKAQPTSTLIPTPKGYKRLGNINVGDRAYGCDGKEVIVSGVYPQGKKRVYEVFFEDGTSTKCSDEHLWSVYIDNSTNKICTLKEIIEMKKNGIEVSIPRCSEIERNEVSFGVSPFLFGSVLGKYITHISQPLVIKYVETSCYEYEHGSIKQRMDFLQGIFSMITTVDMKFGTWIECVKSTNQHDTNTNKGYDGSILVVLKCIKRICESLTIKSYIVDSDYSYTLYLEPTRYYMTRIFAKNTNLIKEIEDNYEVTTTDKYKLITHIKDCEYEDDMVCIYVENDDHLYLTNDYIVTHNTTVIKYFIDRIGLKYDNVYFLAYMGKAVSQLQKNGLPGKTIHSAIYDYVEYYERNEDGKYIIKKNGKPKKAFRFELKDRLPKKIKLIVVDEASMVPEDIAYDLMSFNIPIVVLGDLNQLPPIFGESVFLRDPDVILKQVMRQKEGDPIVWLAQRVLDGKPLNKGVYGNSAIIDKSELNEFNFKNANIVITGTNRLRHKINDFYRERLKEIKRLEYPHIGEKVICRKNNWNESVDGVFLTNGTAGYVTDIRHDSFDHISMKMDFRADYAEKEFTDLVFDYYHMYNMEVEPDYATKYFFNKNKLNVFEYAYALTVHSVQGSTYSNVLFMAEDAFGDADFKKKFMYTGITRASTSLTIVL